MTKLLKAAKSTFHKYFMPWEIGKPIALPWGGWTKFDNEQKAKYPIRFFLFDTIPEKIGHKTYWLDRKIWEFKHKYIRKHNYSTIRTSLDPKHYYDPRERILYATMDMVKEFVEIAGPQVVWDSDPHHAHVWKELQEVYDWWVNKYPNREDKLEELPDVEFEKIIGEDSEKYQDDEDVKEWRRVSKLHNEAEVEWVEEEKQMLIRVMKIRETLWYP